MSVAKKAVDSTLKRILNYTTEIIMSIFLLVIICLPLAFVVPMWLQILLLGRTRAQVALDPVRWFGLDGAAWLTLFLGLVSFVLGYVFILKMKPGITAEEIEEESVEDEELEAEELEEEEEFKELEAEELEEQEEFKELEAEELEEEEEFKELEAEELEEKEEDKELEAEEELEEEATEESFNEIDEEE